MIFILRNDMNLFNKIWSKENDEEKKAKSQRELELLYAEYQDMVCLGVPLKANLNALPSKRRSFHLKFQDFKRKVCLPYSQ